MSVECRLGTHPAKLLDVSLGGVGGVVELEGQNDYMPPLEETLILEITTAAGDIETFQVEVVRVDAETGRFGCRFSGLSTHQFRLMEKLTLGQSI